MGERNSLRGLQRKQDPVRALGKGSTQRRGRGSAGIAGDRLVAQRAQRESFRRGKAGR